ncbi:MAG: CpaF family protein [Pseudomonadota bacterium]
MAVFKHFGRPAAVPRPAAGKAAAAEATTSAHPRRSPNPGVPRSWHDLKTHLHGRLLEELNLSAVEKVGAEELRHEVTAIVTEIVTDESIPLAGKEFGAIVDELLDEVLGLGPLEPLLKDPTVNDILVNTHANVYVERKGMLELTEARFQDESHLLRIIDKIVSAVGRRIDESQPYVDARLADGSRVNAIIRPCALDGPVVSIRKFASVPLTMERLIEHGALTEGMAGYLRAVVKARLNVIISGGTGSGKTTMLNALSRYIGERERIVTIEDAAELQLQQSHVVRMETRPSNIEGKGEVSMRDLVRNALRMRPDRIVVGEVRGAEVLDMLQAMNTGHDGSMTTIHANTPRDGLARLEHMLLMTGIDFPARAMRGQISGAVHVVLQLNRLSDGSRRITAIEELTGMEGDVITSQTIFTFEQTGIDDQGKVLGYLTPTGIRSRFLEVMRSHGADLLPKIFAPLAPPLAR